MPRYFASAEELAAVKCFLCGGTHQRRDCPNKRCSTCGDIGHQRCGSEAARQCWTCLGRHPKTGRCAARLFSAEALTKSVFSGNTTPLCVCGATDHLNCKPLPTPKAAEEHCTLCGGGGHNAYGCRKLGFIGTLIKLQREAAAAAPQASGGQRGQRSGFIDPRFPLQAAPLELSEGPPAPVQAPLEVVAEWAGGADAGGEDVAAGGGAGRPKRSEAAQERRDAKKKAKKDKKRLQQQQQQDNGRKRDDDAEVELEAAKPKPKKKKKK